MDVNDLRLGSIIKDYNAKEIYDVVFIGFPYDEGTLRNCGRIGAKKGPDEIRKLLYKMGTIYNPEFDIDISGLRISDYGNIEESHEKLEDAHIELIHVVEYILSYNKAIPIILGGSNDQSYANISGWLNSSYKGMHNKLNLVINIDAHLDVRELKNENVHSGSPFRMLLEDNRFDGNFIEFASQGSQCSKNHVEFIKQKGHEIIWLSTINEKLLYDFWKKIYYNYNDKSVFLSFDIDSIKGSECPGVSCPCTIGLSSEYALKICFLAGKSKKIGMFDISEFNPKVENSITPRLIVNMIYYFLMGLSQ